MNVMSKVRIELNRSEVGELLKSDEVRYICKQFADSAVSRLGDGYSVNTYVGKWTANAEVTADTAKARKENAETNSILKALR